MWQHTDQTPILTTDEIHIWRAHLDLSTEQLNRVKSALSNEEIERVKRFVFPIHQQRFAAARGILRYILSKYLPQDPADITFGYNAFGKPHIATDNPSLYFNLSHANALALYAIGLQPHIGIDIEQIQENIEVESIAQRFFSTEEYEAIRNLLPTERKRAFFNIWTRKEAFIKARGDGLSFPLKDFTVNYQEEARLMHISGKDEEASHWFLTPLYPGDNYIATLANPRRKYSIQLYQFGG
jgi:4'-phosphopantetheinyl transferase